MLEVALILESLTTFKLHHYRNAEDLAFNIPFSLCVSLYSLWLSLCLSVRDPHLVDEDAVRRCCAVAVQLHRVGKLVIGGAGEKRIVRDIHRHPNSIDGQCVMQNGVRCGVIMK